MTIIKVNHGKPILFSILTLSYPYLFKFDRLTGNSFLAEKEGVYSFYEEF